MGVFSDTLETFTLQLAARSVRPCLEEQIVAQEQMAVAWTR
jgi:hypothetical protein